MTIKDIARLSGYSLGTVSRVLNNRPDVSEKARERILAVVERENFQPNVNAKHLKLRAQQAVAILVKGSSNMLFADILERIQDYLRKGGEECFVCYLDEDANEVAFAVQLYRERKPRGILFLGGNLEYFRRDFSELTVPAVLLTNAASELSFSNLSSLTTDDCDAAGCMAEYLIRMGHRRIGVIGGNLSGAQVSIRRLMGIEEKLAVHGILFDRALQYEPSRFSMREGYEATQRLMKRAKGITAIFALSDVIAFGVMRALADMGLSVPRDISVVGYDGISTAHFSIPRLTTVRQRSEEIALRGVRLLLERIHYPVPAEHAVIAYDLIPGESVRSIAAEEQEQKTPSFGRKNEKYDTVTDRSGSGGMEII